jgi:hypothetical protein
MGVQYPALDELLSTADISMYHDGLIDLSHVGTKKVSFHTLYMRSLIIKTV